MIHYDAGYWGVMMMFQLRGSVFPKAIVWAIPCTIVAGGLHYILNEYPEASERFGVGDAAASVFGGFNFILGFLIVFRSQQAYARWWEGGTLLQQLRGEWFNAFSCLIAFCNAAQEKQQDVFKFQQQMVRLFSLLHGSALMQVSQSSTNHFELIGLDGFDEHSLRFLQTCPDKCEVALAWIQRLIVESEQKQILKIPPPILSRVYNELGNGIVNLNNARKIKDFPIPFPLAQMNMVMLCFHAVFTPLICAATVQQNAWACLLAFVLTFSFWTILYIALELEMPYGDDQNDLPLRNMAQDMNRSLLKMMELETQTVPPFSVSESSKLQLVDVDMDDDLSVVGRSKESRDRSKFLKAGGPGMKSTPSEQSGESLHPFGATVSTASASVTALLSDGSYGVSGVPRITHLPEAPPKEATSARSPPAGPSTQIAPEPTQSPQDLQAQLPAPPERISEGSHASAPPENWLCQDDQPPFILPKAEPPPNGAERVVTIAVGAPETINAERSPWDGQGRKTGAQQALSGGSESNPGAAAPT